MTKRNLLKIILLTGLVLPSVFPVVNAQDLVLNYDGFYNRIKKSKKADYNNTKLGIFLKNRASGQHCQISDARIRLDNAVTIVDIAQDNELMLPFDKALRDDKAKLFITVADESDCDLSFQIMTVSSDVTSYKTGEIVKQIIEFDQFLGDMAGYFGRLNLPTTIGVQIIFAEETQAYTQSGKLFKQGDKVSISQDEILNQHIDGIRFDRKPLRVIPLTEL